LSPKLPFFNDALAKIYSSNGSANTGYLCAGIGGDRQEKYFSPVGVLLSGLFSKLAWTFLDMRTLEEYFRKVNLRGAGGGKMRLWGIEIYSEGIREKVFNGQLSNGSSYDEWSVGFF
jgi:hypothetical protein